MKKIKWITKFCVENNNERRNYSLSTQNVKEYIISLMIENGWDVEIISPTITLNDTGYYKSRTVFLNNNLTVHSFATFGSKSKFGKSLSKIYSLIQLIYYVIAKVEKNEIILVGHSLIYAAPLYITQKIKKFRMILNLGEEYNKVIKGNKVYQWAEPRLIKSADKYIFANDLMSELYNVNRDKYIVVYGQYQNNITKQKQDTSDNKIHLVYAGIISRKEKSAFRAIELADYLDERYVIHILGTPDSSVTTDFFEIVKSANENCTSGCIIKYDGVKNGADYITHLSKFDVGLNLRSVDEEYIDFAFPSKILSYLNIGLRVVSSRIKCVEKSKVGHLLYYFDENNPICIAETIKKIDFNKAYDSNKVLNSLSSDLSNKLDEFLLK